MLAYYRTIVKKEDLLSKLSLDAKELSSVANDLVCKVKEFSVLCDKRDVETASENIKEAEELIKITSAMISNLNDNFNSYLVSLVPEKKEEQIKETQNKKEENPETNQLSSMLEAIRALKEMKESLNEK